MPALPPWEGVAVSIDLRMYELASSAANMLVVAVGALDDAYAIERLADDLSAVRSSSPLHPLVISDLRVRAEHVRELTLEGAYRLGRLGR